MSVDERADILSRLGILQSTLKYPHRKSRSRTQSMEDDSSSSDDCVFESDRISITRHQHCSDDETNTSSRSISKTWILFTFFYLLFVFAFNNATFANDIVGPYGEASGELRRLYTLFTPSFLLGVIFAGFVYKRHDTLLVCASLLSLTVAVALMTDCSLSFFLFICTSICFGFVQRGCISAVGLIKNPHRLIFGVCLTLALASLAGSLVRQINYDNQMVIVKPNPTIPHLVQKREIHIIDDSSASIGRVMAALPADNPYRANVSKEDQSSAIYSQQTIVDAVNATVGPLIVELAMPAALNSSIPLLLIQSVNQTANATLMESAVNGTAMLTTVGPTSTTDISERVFQTKTEENKVMRQEAKRKRREKEEALRKSAAMTTTTSTAKLMTTTMNTTTTPDTTSTTSTTTTTVAPTTTTVSLTASTAVTTHAPSMANLRWPTAAADQLVTVRRGILNTLGNGDDIVSSVHFYDDGPAAPFAPSVVADNVTTSSFATGTDQTLVSWLWWPKREGYSTAKRLVSWTIAVLSTVFLAVHIYRRRFGPKAPTAALSCSLKDELLRANDGKTYAESGASCALSFAVWSMLFTVERTVTKEILLCSLDHRGPNELYQFLPVFWLVVVAASVFLIAWHKNADAGKGVHFMYAIALMTCLFFHQSVEMTYSISLIRFFLIGVVCSVGTWLMAAWLVALTYPDLFAFSARLVMAGMTGKAASVGFLRYSFAYYESDQWQTCLAHTGPKVHAFIFILLAISYVLFVALCYTAQRADRQHQIIQLSDEINGRQSQRSVSRKRRRRRAPVANNGQYVALMDEERDSTKLQMEDISDYNNLNNGRSPSGLMPYDETTGDELSDDAEAIGQFRQV